MKIMLLLSLMSTLSPLSFRKGTIYDSTGTYHNGMRTVLVTAVTEKDNLYCFWADKPQQKGNNVTLTMYADMVVDCN